MSDDVRASFNRSDYDRNLRRRAQDLREQRLQKWAEYDRCPDCNALPGNPCRERAVTGAKVTINNAHHIRPKRVPS